MDALRGRLLALKSRLIPRPTPAAIIHRDRIAALPDSQRDKFLTRIGGYKFGHKNLVEDALLQAEWDSHLITSQDLHAILSARIAKGRTGFSLKIEQGWLKSGVEGDVIRLRFKVGRLPKSSLVLARHVNSEWKIEASYTDLFLFLDEIQNPRPQTEPWKPQSRRGRVGSVPAGWK